MESTPSPIPLGFHYFTDMEHYRLQDALDFIPLIKSVRGTFLFLPVYSSIAIPEYFLSAWIAESIQPIIHLKIPIENASQNHDLYLLIETYAKRGIKHLIFFDRPNMRRAWPPPVWVLSNLVERFVDQILPLFEFANKLGVLPVLPPLEPGGDYWDTLFLKSTLQALQRRNAHLQFGYSAYGWTCGHPLNWGAGGPERWPLSLPYHPIQGNEDHRGIRIFEWYSSIAKSFGFDHLPLFILDSGKPDTPLNSFEEWQAIEILNLIRSEQAAGKDIDVQTLGLWMPGKMDSAEFQRGIEKIKEWQDRLEAKNTAQAVHPNSASVIEHYVLVGDSHPAITDWRLRASHAFVLKHKATLGFSLQQASKAKRVTILATEEEIPEENLNDLRHQGILVERISETGTALATILRER